MTKVQLQENDAIQPRRVGDEVPEIASADPGMSQYQFNDLHQYVEFAKVMCQAGEMLPEHCRNRPAICLAVTMRAVHWGFDPFALATESFQVKSGGPIGWQAKVFTAVMRKAGIELQYRYEGEVEILDKPVKSPRGNEIAKRTAKGNRKCIAYLKTPDGKSLEYETPTLDEITIKNSPLWHNDPDQQLAYYAGRGWARRHRTDLMMGAYSVDEVREMRQMRDVTPRAPGFAALAAKAREEAAKGGESAASAEAPDDTETAPETDERAAEDAPQYDPDMEAAGGVPIPDREREPDTTSNAYLAGQYAAINGDPRGSCPVDQTPEEVADWFAGYDMQREGSHAEA